MVSPDNEVYVLDAGNARVQVFDGSGKFLRKFGSEGKGPGEFQAPPGLALEAGVRLYVGDRGNNRVQVFTLRQTPAVPRDMTAQARPNEIQLSWKPNTESYLEQYTVYRAESPTGPFKAAGTTNEPFFMDKGLPSNKTFFYRGDQQGARRERKRSLVARPPRSTPRLVPATPRKISIEALEKQITLSWLPNLEPFMSHYRVYRDEAACRRVSNCWQRRTRPCSWTLRLPTRRYYYYQITAVGKEGDESPPSEVVFASTPKAALSLPPLEIAKVEIGEIFCLGVQILRVPSVGQGDHQEQYGQCVSRRSSSASRSRISWTIPRRSRSSRLPAKQQVELQLKPVFSNRILEVTENTPVQSEIALTYYIAGEPRTVTRSFPVTLYERHAMVWDQKAKLGAFVTPKDPPVAEFARAVIRPYVDAYPEPAFRRWSMPARIYEALGVLGLKYIVDPTSPFQEFSENSRERGLSPVSARHAVAQERRLRRPFRPVRGAAWRTSASARRSSTCRAMCSSCSIPACRKRTGRRLGFPDELLVPYQGTVWIPVEMTMVGSSFTRAWQKAAEEYREWSRKRQGRDRASRRRPGSSSSRSRCRRPRSGPRRSRARRSRRLTRTNWKRWAGSGLRTFPPDISQALKKNPNDLAALAQLGILYGENGLYAEALEQFQKMLAAGQEQFPGAEQHRQHQLSAGAAGRREGSPMKPRCRPRPTMRAPWRT